ncbi:MAG: helix-turn-helix domain-containing protein [Aequorivita antarctica]
MIDFVTATEVTAILGCNRTHVERLQLSKKLIPVPTVHARYYFKRKDVLKLKEAQNAKTKTNV